MTYDPNCKTPGSYDEKDPTQIRRGYWMQTYTGGQFFPQDPRPEDFRAEDFIHALAIENRFCGHLAAPYSVAQHCVLVKNIVESQFGILDRVILRWALLHDAPEGYIKDIPRPVKRALGAAYSDMETAVMNALCTRYGLPFGMPPIIKRADEVALATEKRDLFPDPEGHSGKWTLTELPSPHFSVKFIGWSDAKAMFQKAWDEVAP